MSKSEVTQCSVCKQTIKKITFTNGGFLLLNQDNTRHIIKYNNTQLHVIKDSLSGAWKFFFNNNWEYADDNLLQAIEGQNKKRQEQKKGKDINEVINISNQVLEAAIKQTKLLQQTPIGLSDEERVTIILTLYREMMSKIE